jgi:predicted nucleic acid-binding protein
LSIDLGASLRRIKPDQHRTLIAVRPRHELTAAADIAGAGRAALLLDTSVYIHSAAGTLPATAAVLVDRGLLFHCAVCIGEMVTGIAASDPHRPNWIGLRNHYLDLIARMPATRVLTPDDDVWAEAGLIAGTLARSQGFQPHQRKECLNDALIFLTAAKAGLPVLTSNRDEFDLIQQIASRGTFVHY